MEKKKYIGNVGVLDFRGATKEVVDKIAAVGNVGMLLYCKENKSLLADLQCKNVGSMTEVEKDTRVVNGLVEIDHQALVNADKPLSYLVNGKIVIGADATSEDIERGLGKLWINGLILCPKNCMPAVRERVVMVNGQILPIEDDYRIVYESLDMIESTLKTLAESVNYLVLGAMRMLDDFDIALLENIRSIKVYGKIQLRQRYADVLGDRIETMGKIEIIPDDAILLDDDIEIDSIALNRWNKARIWTKSRIRFNHDVTPEQFKAHIALLKCDDLIICRKDMRPAVLEACEKEPEMIAYDNDLIIVDGDQTLSNAELKFRVGTFALFVSGKLSIEPDVDAQTLFDRIEFIVNHGKIVCHGDMCGALRARIRENKGKVVDADIVKEKPKEDKEYLVENAGFFTL